MIKKHENKEGKNPMDFFIQEVTFVQKVIKEKKIETNKVNGYKRIDELKLLTSMIDKDSYRFKNSYVFVGALLIKDNNVNIVSILNNTEIKLIKGDYVIPLYLKLERLFNEEITTLTIECMIEDTVSLFSELEDKIVDYYFYAFSLFDFDIDFINVLFSKIKTHYLIDYFVTDNQESRSAKVIKLDGKKDFQKPKPLMAYNLKVKQSKKIINSIKSYLSNQVDINDILFQLIQKIKYNNFSLNRSFFADPTTVENFEYSIQQRIITLFEKLSFDEQVLFISNLEQEFYSFEEPKVLSFLLSDLFIFLQNNKRFEERKESLLANNAFIDSLVTCSAVILCSKENELITCFETKSIAEQLFRFLFIDNKEKAQVLLFEKLESILFKGFNQVYLDNFLLYQLLLSEDIVLGFVDNFIDFLKNNLNFISIHDEDDGSSICTKNNWLLSSGTIRKSTEIILNKIRTDSDISSAILKPELDDDWDDDWD